MKLTRHLLRLVIGVACALGSWSACVAPLDSHGAIKSVLCRALNWPVATAGLLFGNWRGLDVFYGNASCEFCGAAAMFRYHMLLAVPVYVALIYAISFAIVVLRRKFRVGPVSPGGAALR